MEIFIRKWSEISGGRFDPIYHKDEYTNLERTIKSKSNLTLQDFIISISSGATPDKNKAHLYYTNDAQSGIPFLRVQNIKPDSTISNDFIYITKQTHEGLLQRSQVTEGDLIVTITGRLCTAAVAPQGFIGNINQHSVVIKTKDFKTSQTLATYLNTSIGEKLALRRAAGGTRPALDYIALKSIPVVYDERIIDIMDNAYVEKRRKEREAQEILDSIDDFLLSELGITLPPKATNDLQSRIFFVELSEISGTRFDAEYHQSYYTALQNAINQGKYAVAKIRDLMDNVKDLSQPFEEKVIYVEIGDIEVENATIDLKTMPLEKLPNNTKICIKQGDLLISTVRPNRKAIAIYENENIAYCTSAFCVLRENGKYKKELLQYLLRTSIFNALIVRNTTGSTYPTINNSDILNLKIPLPPLPVQKKIADEIIKRKQKALNLQKEAKDILKSVKIQVEKIILGR